nr:hypothetical protein [Angustibacter aerolatus]
MTDAAYATTKVLTIDTSRRPAVITREPPVTRDGQPIGLDAEGVAARRGGGYWLGVEGAKGPGNQAWCGSTRAERCSRSCRCRRTSPPVSGRRASRASR